MNIQARLKQAEERAMLLQKNTSSHIPVRIAIGHINSQEDD